MLALFLPNPTNFVVLMRGGVGVVLSQPSLLSLAMVGNVESGLPVMCPSCCGWYVVDTDEEV